jgi:hypothetical protein
MTDHLTADDRLQPLMTLEQPGWIADLCAIAAVLTGIGLIVALGYIVQLHAVLDEAQGERDLWMEVAMQPAPAEIGAVVRIEPEGSGFRCSHQQVRREWELAVAAECQVMGALLHMARASQ